MSLSPISQYASTSGTNFRITSSTSTSGAVRAPAQSAGAPVESLKATIQTLASGEEKQVNGLTQEASGDAKTSVNVAYDRLTRQSDIGPGAQHVNQSLQSYLASYQQNSAGAGSAQSSGSLFSSSA